MLRAGRVGLLALVALFTIAGVARAQGAPATGYLDWGVKASFRNYIAGPIAKGQIALGDGVTRNADGTFRFPLTGDTFDRELRSGLIRAGGTVRFTGHDMGAGPLLDMTLSNPRVEVGETTSKLFADVKSKSLSSGSVVEYPNVEFAALEGGAPASVLAPVPFGPFPATLTAAGVPAFADFYPAGTELDAVSIRVAAWATVPVEPTPDPTPDPTVTPAPAPIVPAATPAPAATVTPAPEVVAPAVKRVAARQTIKRTGVVRLAALTCGSAACTVSRPKTVTVKIAGRSYKVAVSGPTKLSANRRGELRLKLSTRAVRALGKRTVNVKLTVTVSSGGQRVKQTVSTRFKLR